MDKHRKRLIAEVSREDIAFVCITFQAGGKGEEGIVGHYYLNGADTVPNLSKKLRDLADKLEQRNEFKS